MQIIKKTPEKLIVDAPQWLGRIVGLIFFIAGCYGFIYFSMSFRIDCFNKQPGKALQCNVYHPVPHFLGFEDHYQQIDKAKIISRIQKGNKQYSLRLYTDNGRHFLIRSFNADRTLVKAARDTINQYIESGRNLLVVPNYIAMEDKLLFAFFIIFSLIFLYIASSNRLVLNQSKKKAILEKKFLGLFSLWEKRIYSFEEIDRFIVSESNSKRQGRQFQLLCLLKNRDEFAINTVTNGDKAKKQMIADTLNQFIQ